MPLSQNQVICKNWCGWKLTVPWKSVTNKKLGPLVLSMFLLSPEVTIDVMTWICESFFWQGEHLWFKKHELKTTILDFFSDPIRINKGRSHLFQPVSFLEQRSCFGVSPGRPGAAFYGGELGKLSFSANIGKDGVIHKSFKGYNIWS